MTQQPEKFIFQVEEGKEGSDGRPSVGPVYRSVYAKDGFPEPIEGMDSCWDVFRMAVEKYPNNQMLGRREIVDGKPGKYVWQTYQEVYDIVIKLGNALRNCGVEEQAKCGIYGANSPEWIISMEACNAHGLYCVPLYDTLGAGAVEFIITHSEVSIVFVEEKKISELFKTCPNATEYMKTVVSFGGVTREQKEAAETFGLVIYAWDDFLKLGEEKQFDLPIKKKSDICTIMYTSGTTGDPKGVMISNESIVTLIAGVIRLLKSANEALTVKDVYLSYLPLAHIFDRVIEECFIQHGAAIGFWRGDVKLLIEDLGELKPTIFCAVPRVLDRVYSGLQQKLAAGGFFKKFMFDSAFSFKYGHMKKGQSHVEASPLCDKLVFSKVKQGLGGNVRIILSGAAPLASHVESFLRVVACCHVLQGYGLTESCAGTFVSLPDRLDMLGTVGPPVPNVDIRLESVPEMEYDALASTPRGEICIRGKTLFSGYYKREDLTKEVLIDGWLHTGDVGEWQPNGSMKIIDRKKNIFKLSQGEYVAVENLENIYGEVQAVDSVWVYGNSFESFLIAVANPNQHILEKWAAENGVSGDYNALCQNAKAKEFILGELVKMGKEKKMKGFEIIKAVHLDPVPFDMERDLLTPTYKKKRPQLLQRTGRVYVAGGISLVIGLLMWITSLPQIRRKCFETFYYTHHLYTVFLVSFLFHAGDRHFYWILPGVFLFGLDKTLRIVQSRSESRVLSARLYSCKAVELVLPKDPRLNYAPSSFIFMNIPSISQFQWHPFSITSSSSVDKHTMSVMMKCEGKWTDSVYKKLEEAADSNTKINNITIRVEGPYGPVSVDFLRYDTLFLVAGGIGITPFLNILQELACENRLKTPKSVQLVFSVRTFQDINMLLPVSPILFRPIHNLNLKIKVFVTQEKKHSNGPTTLKEYLAQSQVQTIHVGTDEDFSRFQILGHESFRRLATLVLVALLTFLGLLIGLSHFFIPNEHKKHSNSMKLAASGTMTTAKEKVPSWVPDLVIIVAYVIAMTIGGLAAIILQWRRQRRETLRMTKEEVNPQGSNFTESTPIVPIEEHEIHIGERPKFKEILSEFETSLRGWSSIGVLVCGPESMKEAVASICRQRFQCFGVDDSRTIHNKVNLNFHSLNFSL